MKDVRDVGSDQLAPSDRLVEVVERAFVDAVRQLERHLLGVVVTLVPEFFRLVIREHPREVLVQLLVIDQAQPVQRGLLIVSFDAASFDEQPLGIAINPPLLELAREIDLHVFR